MTVGANCWYSPVNIYAILRILIQNFASFRPLWVKIVLLRSVTFCLINSLDLQFFVPTQGWGGQKIALVKWCIVWKYRKSKHDQTCPLLQNSRIQSMTKGRYYQQACPSLFMTFVNRLFSTYYFQQLYSTSILFFLCSNIFIKRLGKDICGKPILLTIKKTL